MFEPIRYHSIGFSHVLARDQELKRNIFEICYYHITIPGEVRYLQVITDIENPNFHGILNVSETFRFLGIHNIFSIISKN